MASSSLAHPDDDRFALVGKADANEVSRVIPSIHGAAHDTLELLRTQCFDRFVAALPLESLCRVSVEPLHGTGAATRIDLAEERVDHVAWSDRWLPRAPENAEGRQRPGLRGLRQVPEQDGANSSSSAAETNSSLHQNDASECPLRTHWSWSWQSHVSCWLPPGQPAPQLP